LLAVALAALVLGARYGARSLDALVVPSLVALAFGAVQVYRGADPSVRRSTPVPGFPGERRTVRATVTSDLPCDVSERCEAGLRPVDADARLPGGRAYEYDLELRERGEHVLGPASIVQRDTLGLVARATEGAATTPVLVYPSVVPVSNRTVFAGLVERSGTEERESFDRLREYTRSDSLRDINWKASAKREADEFVVTEFAAEDEGGLSVVCEADAGHADAMATAAASVVTYLLDANLLVSLAAPAGECEEARGEEQRNRCLELLARTGPGTLRGGQADRADVHVRATDEGVRVRVGDRRHPFERLVGADTVASDAVAPSTDTPDRERDPDESAEVTA
jgi:uncharacterized protein (DUF58 family)